MPHVSSELVAALLSRAARHRETSRRFGCRARWPTGDSALLVEVCLAGNTRRPGSRQARAGICEKREMVRPAVTRPDATQSGEARCPFSVERLECLTHPPVSQPRNASPGAASEPESENDRNANMDKVVFLSEGVRQDDVDVPFGYGWLLCHSAMVDFRLLGPRDRARPCLRRGNQTNGRAAR